MRKIIEGDINLDNLYLTELFDLSDVEVKGRFNCITNYLTSLKGSPHTAREFMCTGNLLTNLIGGPHTVKWSYWCSFTQLTSLEGAPHTVGGYFSCEENPLKSLKGIPKYIGGSFYINYNLHKEFPEEYIRSLSDIKGRIGYW